MKPDLDALEVNAYPFLVLVGYAASAQRNAQSGMIDRFQKARPESLVNGDGGLDDPRGKRLEFMAQGSSSGSITKTQKYESTKKSRTGTLPCLGCQRPAANAAFWEWTRADLTARGLPDCESRVEVYSLILRLLDDLPPTSEDQPSLWYAASRLSRISGAR